jgi:hypothetical protein
MPARATSRAMASTDAGDEGAGGAYVPAYSSGSVTSYRPRIGLQFDGRPKNVSVSGTRARTARTFGLTCALRVHPAAESGASWTHCSQYQLP